MSVSVSVLVMLLSRSAGVGETGVIFGRKKESIDPHREKNLLFYFYFIFFPN